jgi:hypothetical protein
LVDIPTEIDANPHVLMPVAPVAPVALRRPTVVARCMPIPPVLLSVTPVVSMPAIVLPIVPGLPS